MHILCHLGHLQNGFDQLTLTLRDRNLLLIRILIIQVHVGFQFLVGLLNSLDLLQHLVDVGKVFVIYLVLLRLHVALSIEFQFAF